MMWEGIVAAAGALWLGIFTSIQPCPLATNIAAISYVGRCVENPRQALLRGLLYALGRTLAYLGLAVLLVASVLSSHQLAQFLQRYMNRLLGPILILVAMLLLGLIRIGFSGSGVSDKLQKRVDAWGVWGALLLGIVFALSFCPLSAAIFFLTLIPLSIQANSAVALPSLYGIGTALPVLVFAVLVAWSAQSVGKAFNKLTQIEWWVRKITGSIFLAVGIHYSLKYSFGVTPFWDPWVQYLVSFLPTWSVR